MTNFAREFSFYGASIKALVDSCKHRGGHSSVLFSIAICTCGGGGGAKSGPGRRPEPPAAVAARRPNRPHVAAAALPPLGPRRLRQVRALQIQGWPSAGWPSEGACPGPPSLRFGTFCFIARQVHFWLQSHKEPLFLRG